MWGKEHLSWAGVVVGVSWVEGGVFEVGVGFLRMVTTDVRRGMASTVLEAGGARERLWPRQEVLSGDVL